MSTASFPYDLPPDGSPFVLSVDGTGIIRDTGASKPNDTRHLSVDADTARCDTLLPKLLSGELSVKRSTNW